jgi:hypothetical protein
VSQNGEFLKRPAGRRSFLQKGALFASAASVGAGLLTEGLAAFGGEQSDEDSQLTRGDIAILRFLAAAELIEADMWIQYAELGGVTDGAQNNYQQAFQFLDGDGSQYITSNTLDEVSHATFLNAYLESKGADPVDFDRFRDLPSSQATGAKNIGRLTNLAHLNVDTSWYIRYRSTTNPDFGATFPQAITITNRTGIPLTDSDFDDANHIQVIADTAAFHFGTIEQGGSSLYSTLSRKTSSLEALKIVVCIGGDEVAHFLEWVDFAGNAVQGPPFSFAGSTTPVSDNGLTFPDFNALNNPLFQTNLIFPVPCEFIHKKLPHCAVIRPASDPISGAVAAAHAFINMGIFAGQRPEFTKILLDLGEEADAAQRRT